MTSSRLPMLSVRAHVPPGLSTRATSANAWSCCAAVGMWWSILKHTTAEKRASGSAVASPWTTLTPPDPFPSSARSRSQ
jgi:hypothetical protein